MENKWNKLSIKDKNELILLFIRSGIKDLNQMKDTYNNFDIYNTIYSNDNNLFATGSKINTKSDNPPAQFEYTPKDYSYLFSRDYQLQQQAEQIKRQQDNTRVTSKPKINAKEEIKAREEAVKRNAKNNNSSIIIPIEYQQVFYDNYIKNYLKKYNLSNNNSPIVRNVIKQANENFIKTYGKNNLPQPSVINKHTIINKMPANANAYDVIGKVGVIPKTLGLLLTGDKNRAVKQSDEIFYNTNTKEKRDKAIQFMLNNGASKEDAINYMKDNFIGRLNLEDAKRLFLQMPQRYKKLQPAKYKPTMSNSRNNQYYEYKDYNYDGFFADDLIAAGDRLRNRNLRSNATVGKIVNFDPDKRLTETIGKSGRNMLTALPAVGQSTVGYGLDNKGEYYSLFDDWDVNFGTKGGGSKFIESMVGGKKLDTYNRIYLKDYYKHKTGIDFDYNSYFLPEVEIKLK